MDSRTVGLEKIRGRSAAVQAVISCLVLLDRPFLLERDTKYRH